MIKRRIIAVLLAFVVMVLSFTVAFAQMVPELYVRVILEPSLDVDVVYGFSDGIAAVKVINDDNSFRLGYVDRTGQFIVPLRDYPAMPGWQTPMFSHALVSVYSPEEGAVGFYNAAGGLAMPFIYDRDRAFQFVDGLAAVRRGGNWGFIDINGDERIPFDYQRTGDFSEGLAPAMWGGRWGFISYDGEEEIPFVFDHFISESGEDNFIQPGVHEGRAAVVTRYGGQHVWGFIDRAGNMITQFIYTRVEDFAEGRALVMFEDETETPVFGFIDRSGREAVPMIYSDARSFSEGLAAVRYGENDLWGFVDEDGDVIIPMRFSEAYSFNEGLAATSDLETGRWGFIDTGGDNVIPHIYYEVRAFSEGLAAVRRGEGQEARWGFIDTAGNILVEIEHLDVTCFSGGLAWILGTDGWGVLQADYQGQGPGSRGGRYIYQPAPEYRSFSPPAGVIADIDSAAGAQTAVSNAARSLTPWQRDSGDALNIFTLYVENAIRRGAAISLPVDGIVDADILAQAAYLAGDIWRGALSGLAEENIRLMRPLRIGINFTAYADGFSLIFPDDVGAIDFDYITIEAGIARLTINHEYILPGSEISVSRLMPAVSTEEDGAGLVHEIIDMALEYWAAAVILSLLLLWGILALMGHRFRCWVVPVFSLLAIVGNLYTLGIIVIGDNREPEYSYGPLEIAQFEPIAVTMTPGMRVTLSIPVGGDNPDYLVLFDGAGEPKLSKYNPVTDTIDARIRQGGIFTLRHNYMGFDDIAESDPMIQEAALRLASLGVISAEGEFRPNEAIARAEFTGALVSVFDLMNPGASGYFIDLNPSDLHYQAVATAAYLGLVQGFGDSTFRGGLPMTKDQAVLAIAGAMIEQMGYFIPYDMGEVLLGFYDRNLIETWSEPDIALVTVTGILLRREDNLFAPGSLVTRGDAAILLSRLLDRLW